MMGVVGNIMKMSLLSSTFLLILTSFRPAGAETYTHAQYLDMIYQYVEKTANIYDGTWAYSYLTHDIDDNETELRRIDPSKPFLERESILSVNGEPPSAALLERHQRRMQRRLDRRRERLSERDLVEEERRREGREKERFFNLFIEDSLELVRQEGPLHTVRFRGMEEDRRKIYEHIEAFLVLDTENEYIRELRVKVTEPFSPFLFTHVEDGYFSLRFELVDGVPMQSDATWRLDGHILYIKDIDREEEVEWRDIVPVASSK